MSPYQLNGNTGGGVAPPRVKTSRTRAPGNRLAPLTLVPAGMESRAQNISGLEVSPGTSLAPPLCGRPSPVYQRADRRGPATLLSLRTFTAFRLGVPF